MKPPTRAEVVDFMNFVVAHGGPRTPGKGRKLGRPKKPRKQKAVCITITLSSPLTLKTLQRRAKQASLRPGAYIERELKL